MCSCSLKLPWGSSQGDTIVNHNICQTLQPEFNFGFGDVVQNTLPLLLAFSGLLWRTSQNTIDVILIPMTCKYKWQGILHLCRIWFTEFEIKSSPCTSRNASHWVVCCFGCLQRSKRGEWLLETPLNSFKDLWLSENQCLKRYEVFKTSFVKAAMISSSEGNYHKSLPLQRATDNLLFQTNFYSEQNPPQTYRPYKNLLGY